MQRSSIVRRPSALFLWSAFIFVVLWTVACDPAPETETPAPPPPAPPPPADDTAADWAYRNAVGEPPPGWTGPVFELSHDYPTTDPGACPESECPWLSVPVDFDTTDWEAWAPYLKSIIDYVRQGQTLSPEGWNVDVGGTTRWFHVPWMAYNTKTGREFIHGMTNERTSYLSDLLGDPQSLPSLPSAEPVENGFETWAFGVYNAWGGYAFGQSWGTDGDPQLSGNCDAAPWDGCQPAGLPFPEGTLVTKLLFTTATPELVYYLEGSPTWTANRHVEDETGYTCPREPQDVRLVQMDVAVVDERSPTRWVYGTFGYNGTIESPDPWDRMSPLGVQWGADPGVFPQVPDKSATTIEQTSLAPINIYEHYGCGGRLAGPVDNKLASCMSCHGGGYAALPISEITAIGTNVPPIFGYDGICTEYNETNALYFDNWIFPARWPDFPANMSMDTSLQMQVAFTSYSTYAGQGAPSPCS